jgi:hypothetical protein
MIGGATGDRGQEGRIERGERGSGLGERAARLLQQAVGRLRDLSDLAQHVGGVLAAHLRAPAGSDGVLNLNSATKS